MRRHHLLSGSSVLFLSAALVGCSGASPAPTPTDQSTETFPDLPTLNPSAGDPFDTIPPDPTAAPSGGATAAISCFVQPELVAAGETFVLSVIEGAGWFGKDRYYQVTGLPSSYHEFQTADGGQGTRSLITEAAPDEPAFAGTTWLVDVFVRDWDIHDFHPGPVLPTTIRPTSTQHEGSCSASFNIAYIP